MQTRDEILAARRKRYKNNPDKYRNASANYKKRNPHAIRKYAKDYREKNKEVVKQRTKIWKSKNKEKLKTDKRNWDIANANKIREYDNLYKSDKRNSDVNFRIKTTLRSRVSALVKNNRETSSQLLIGCTIQELRTHLENKFTEGMSWDNYGRDINNWHIDHKMPCAAFDLTKIEQQKACFHYANLQPLWCLDNLSKGKRF